MVKSITVWVSSLPFCELSAKGWAGRQMGSFLFHIILTMQKTALISYWILVLSELIHYTCRGFNDAVNGFIDDGWSIMNCDGADDVIIAVNSNKNLRNTSNPECSQAFPGGVLCARASMLLQVSMKQNWHGCLYRPTLGGLSVVRSFVYFLDWILIET